MMRPIFRMIAALALLVAIVVAATPPLTGSTVSPSRMAPPPTPSRFPHEKHARLFPSCRPCHGGAAEAEEAQLVTATPELCARCHDGKTEPPVDWQPAPLETGNLVFRHESHVGGKGIPCRACHSADAESATEAARIKGIRNDAATATDPLAGPMEAMIRPTPERCLPCHAAPSHLAAEADCAKCHLPLTEVPSLTAERIASFPAPGNHAAPDWLSRHGEIARSDLARCATCHSRETCETCHFNAASIPPIQSLGRDSRTAAQSALISARWPRPADHDDPDWGVKHAAAARSGIEACANCHTRSSCSGCHGGGDMAPVVVAALPESPTGGPAGVTGPYHRPPGHDPGFARNHAAAAAANLPNCASCHAKNFCQDCHNAPATPGFHEPNYLERHAADAYARDRDCAACHSTEVFCRDCHNGVGLGTRPASTSYHDAQPFWLLNHGRAARQGLETCTTCHEQQDCLRCHSAKTGWRINPHGPGFEAQRLSDRSDLMCSRCHFRDPAPK